jgi:hypothetical protein
LRSGLRRTARDENRAATAAILRIAWIALSPTLPDPRHAA